MYIPSSCITMWGLHVLPCGVYMYYHVGSSCITMWGLLLKIFICCLHVFHWELSCIYVHSIIRSADNSFMEYSSAQVVMCFPLCLWSPPISLSPLLPISLSSLLPISLSPLPSTHQSSPYTEHGPPSVPLFHQFKPQHLP